jgi:hypothetical protein
MYDIYIYIYTHTHIFFLIWKESPGSYMHKCKYIHAYLLQMQVKLPLTRMFKIHTYVTHTLTHSPPPSLSLSHTHTHDTTHIQIELPLTRMFRVHAHGEPCGNSRRRSRCVVCSRFQGPYSGKPVVCMYICLYIWMLFCGGLCVCMYACGSCLVSKIWWYVYTCMVCLMSTLCLLFVRVWFVLDVKIWTPGQNMNPGSKYEPRVKIWTPGQNMNPGSCSMSKYDPRKNEWYLHMWMCLNVYPQCSFSYACGSCLVSESDSRKNEWYVYMCMCLNMFSSF